MPDLGTQRQPSFPAPLLTHPPILPLITVNHGAFGINIYPLCRRIYPRMVWEYQIVGTLAAQFTFF